MSEDKELNHKLGEIIINVTIIFLSISFGLFSLSLDNLYNNRSEGLIDISNTVGYSTLILFIIIFGILALGLAYLGIFYNKKWFIHIAGICALIMIVLMIVLYYKIYGDALDFKQKQQLEVLKTQFNSTR